MKTLSIPEKTWNKEEFFSDFPMAASSFLIYAVGTFMRDGFKKNKNGKLILRPNPQSDEYPISICSLSIFEFNQIILTHKNIWENIGLSIYYSSRISELESSSGLWYQTKQYTPKEAKEHYLTPYELMAFLIHNLCIPSKKGSQNKKVKIALSNIATITLKVKNIFIDDFIGRRKPLEQDFTERFKRNAVISDVEENEILYSIIGENPPVPEEWLQALEKVKFWSLLFDKGSMGFNMLDSIADFLPIEIVKESVDWKVGDGGKIETGDPDTHWYVYVWSQFVITVAQGNKILVVYNHGKKDMKWKDNSKLTWVVPAIIAIIAIVVTWGTTTAVMGTSAAATGVGGAGVVAGGTSTGVVAGGISAGSTLGMSAVSSISVAGVGSSGFVAGATTLITGIGKGLSVLSAGTGLYSRVKNTFFPPSMTELDFSGIENGNKSFDEEIFNNNIIFVGTIGLGIWLLIR